MPGPHAAPKVCPATGSFCEYDCLGTCKPNTNGQVAVEPEPHMAYVAVSKEMLVELATGPSAPVIVMGLEPRGPGYELILRRPTLFELQAVLEETRTVNAALGGA